MAEHLEAVSSLRDFEQRELDAGTRSSILDAWGRTLFQNTKSVITRGRSDSGPAVVSTLRDFEQRELEEGARSSLLDSWGRTLFQQTTTAVENTVENTKSALTRSDSRSPRGASAERPDPADFPAQVITRCSWCGNNASQAKLPANEGPRQWSLPRKPQYRCSACAGALCPCDNFPSCDGMAKRLPLWDDALCTECDDRDRAKAQAVLGAMGQIVDEWGVKTSQLVDHVKEHSEGLADKTQLKGMVDKINHDFSKYADHVATTLPTPRRVGEGVAGSVQDVQRQVGGTSDESSAKYFGQMLGHLKEHSHNVFVNVTKGIEDHSEQFTKEVEGHSDKLLRDVGNNITRTLEHINSDHEAAATHGQAGEWDAQRKDAAALERALLTGLSDDTFHENLRNSLQREVSGTFPPNAAVHRGSSPLATREVASGNERGSFKSNSSLEEAQLAQLVREFEVRQQAEMEPWEVVRDVLLTWPCGPEKEYIAKCSHLINQQVWVERWLRTSNRGGSGKVEETVRRLLKHVAWRSAYGVEGILQEDWSAHDARNEMFVSGLDRQQRPSVTWRVSRHDANLPRGQTPQLGARYLVCTIERARLVNPGSRHMIFICDCSGLQWKNFEHAMFVEAVTMLQENYPDNVAHVFLFPVGWLINSLMNVCRPLLDKDTASKMSFLSETEVEAGLRAHFDDDEIEERFGGGLSLDKARTRCVARAETGSDGVAVTGKSWVDRDGCGVARVWLFRDMIDLQRKFIPEKHQHLLLSTPKQLARRRAREVAERLSSSPSSPSVLSLRDGRLSPAGGCSSSHGGSLQLHCGDVTGEADPGNVAPIPAGSSSRAQIQPHMFENDSPSAPAKCAGATEAEEGSDDGRDVSDSQPTPFAEQMVGTQDGIANDLSEIFTKIGVRGSGAREGVVGIVWQFVRRAVGEMLAALRRSHVFSQLVVFASGFFSQVESTPHKHDTDAVAAGVEREGR